MAIAQEPNGRPAAQGSDRRARSDDLTTLLVAVRDGRCEQSFAKLYAFYAPRICAFLRQKGAADRIAQEIMQDVMTNVWERARQFDHRCANASTWIFTIARNRYIDLVRRERRAVIDPEDPLLAGEAPGAPDAALDKEEKGKALKAAIAALPAEQSEVLSLVYLQEMKQQDAADCLDIPLNTVKSRLRLAIQKLRDRMEKF